MFQVEREGTTRIVQEHTQHVAAVQEQLKTAGAASLGRRSGHAVSHMTSGSTPAAASTRALREILDVDPVKRVAWVEPGVTMEELLARTLKVGLMPRVVPEFRSITVGGALMGAALESASFTEGQFSDGVLAAELLLADGTHIEVSPSHHPDLFYGISGSYGSLAMVVSVKLALVPAKGFVRLEYREVIGTQALIETLITKARGGTGVPDFLDAMAVGSERYVVMTGRQCYRDEIPKQANRVDLQKPWAPWFCQHVLRKLHEGPQPDYLTITDYLFRYDRAAFWMGQFVTSTPALWRFWFRSGLGSDDLTEKLHASYKSEAPTLDPSVLFRTLTAGKLSAQQLYGVLHALPNGVFGKTYLVQDFYIPLHRVADFLAHVESAVGIFPLWLCPIKGTKTAQLLSPHYLKGSSREPFDFVNVGVYGIPAKGQSIPEVTAELTRLAASWGGRRVLYAIGEQSKEEFWKSYDRAAYEALRRKYHAVGQWTDLYDRTHVTRRQES